MEGDVDQYGWVINFDTVTEIAKELIEDRCDHMFLRFDENGDLSPTKDYVPMLDGELPSTAENMGQWWFGKIQERLQAVPGHNARISRIDVWETAKCRAIVTSPKNV